MQQVCSLTTISTVSLLSVESPGFACLANQRPHFNSFQQLINLGFVKCLDTFRLEVEGLFGL